MLKAKILKLFDVNTLMGAMYPNLGHQKLKEKKQAHTQMELDSGKHYFGYFFKMETKIDKLDF